MRSVQKLLTPWCHLILFGKCGENKVIQWLNVTINTFQVFRRQHNFLPVENFPAKFACYQPSVLNRSILKRNVCLKEMVSALADGPIKLIHVCTWENMLSLSLKNVIVFAEKKALFSWNKHPENVLFFLKEYYECLFQCGSWWSENGQTSV